MSVLHIWQFRVIAKPIPDFFCLYANPFWDRINLAAMINGDIAAPITAR
ncbi:hypothetical protein [Roseobacter litoralis]|nr:hypothetical protein [Roseobacter litoralis]